MEFESAIATADDVESTADVGSTLATWEHQDLAQVLRLVEGEMLLVGWSYLSYTFQIISLSALNISIIMQFRCKWNLEFSNWKKIALKKNIQFQNKT